MLGKGLFYKSFFSVRSKDCLNHASRELLDRADFRESSIYTCIVFARTIHPKIGMLFLEGPVAETKTQRG